MEINELLDLAKTKANLKSDYALAKVLGIKTGQMSEYRTGKRHPGNEEAVKLATLAGLDEIRVIAEIEMRTANTEKKKEFWRQYIELRGLAPCLAMTALAATIMLTPTHADASILQWGNYDAGAFSQKDPSIHYANNRRRTIKVLFKALLSKWLQFFNPYHPAHNYKYT